MAIRPGPATARGAACCAAISAVLFGCAFAPVGWWPLVAFAAAPLALVVVRRPGPEGFRAALPRRTALAVAGVLAVKWFVLHFWLLQVTGAGTPALAVYCTLHDMLALWLLVRCARALPAGTPWAALLPIAFGAEEAFRALVAFDGYPWFRWGHPLIELPVLVQGADLVGELFASILSLAIAGACLDAWCARSLRTAGVAVGAAFLAGSVGYGAWRLSQAPAGEGPGVLLVQTNLATSNKIAWSPKEQVKDIPSFAELTVRGALDSTAHARPFVLAVWPETMLGGYGLEPDTIDIQERNGWFPGNRFQRVATKLSERLGVPLLAGSPSFLHLRPDADGERFVWDRQFNSAYLVNPGPPPYPRYDKVFLAPFGETMPYISAWPWLQRQMLAIGAQGMSFDLDRGGEPVRFEVPWQGRNVRIATAICFEDAMSWVTRDLVYPASADRQRAADLLVNISNDGWFGWYDPGRVQHLQIARFRCIETRTPMVRAANSGLCAGVDSSGRVTDLPPPPQTASWLRAAPPLDARRAPFAAVGEVGSVALMILGAFLVFRSFLRRPPAAASALLVLAAAIPVLVTGCGDASTAEQPWSSRQQSMQPTGETRLNDAGRAVAQPLPVESSGSAQAAAIALLRHATEAQVPMYRANACEALMLSPDDLRAVAPKLLADPNRGVRFVAAVVVGRAGVKDLADRVQPLLVDESLSVRAAAIYALTKLGRPVDPSPLAAMVRSDDPEVRSNAYMVLGELGNRSAVKMIRDSLGKGMRQANPARVRIVELQAAEALYRLGETDGIEPIRAALYAPGEQSEFTALAAQQVARLKDEGSRAILMRLIDGTGISARPTEVRICCASALAQISPSDRPAVVKFARTLLQDREPGVRSEAALALGYAGGVSVVPELQGSLLDQTPPVQLAAAKAILAATAGR